MSLLGAWQHWVESAPDEDKLTLFINFDGSSLSLESFPIYDAFRELLSGKGVMLNEDWRQFYSDYLKPGLSLSDRIEKVLTNFDDHKEIHSDLRVFIKACRSSVSIAEMLQLELRKRCCLCSGKHFGPKLQSQIRQTSSNLFSQFN